MNSFASEVKHIHSNVMIKARIDWKVIQNHKLRFLILKNFTIVFSEDDYQKECDIYVICSKNHEIYLQKAN